MPVCLAPFSERAFDEELAFDPSPLVPARFHWYPQGASPWSGFGHYEEVRERFFWGCRSPPS